MQITISKAEVQFFIWEKANQVWQERWDREEKVDTYIKVKVNSVGGGYRRKETVDKI